MSITAPTSTRGSGTRSRSAGAFALAAAGVLFLLYAAVRPWGDAAPATAAAAFAAPAWLIAHLAAVAGFVLVGFGLLALRDRLGGLAGAALGIWWAGTGMVLPYYGAEAFALHTIGGQVERSGDAGPLALVEAIRMGPVQITLFGVGLVALAVAAVLAAVAVARSGMLARLSGVAFAAGFALFLPQFYAPPAVRIAHGVLVAVGCAVLAAQLRRAR